MPFPADMGKVSRGKGTMFNSNPLKSYFFNMMGWLFIGVNADRLCITSINKKDKINLRIGFVLFILQI